MCDKTLSSFLCIFFASIVGNTSSPSKKKNTVFCWTLSSNCHPQHCCQEGIIGLHRTLWHIGFSSNKYVTTTFYKTLNLFCKQGEGPISCNSLNSFIIVQPPWGSHLKFPIMQPMKGKIWTRRNTESGHCIIAATIAGFNPQEATCTNSTMHNTLPKNETANTFMGTPHETTICFRKTDLSKAVSIYSIPTASGGGSRCECSDNSF